MKSKEGTVAFTPACQDSLQRGGSPSQVTKYRLGSSYSLKSMIGQARQLSGRAEGGPRQLPGGTGVGRLGAVEVPDGAAVPGRGAATAAAAAAAAAAAGESHTCMTHGY
ncbi:uncharacterized protein LOC135099328 isoform X2 [Scylla paramamosain]|uniref:uncharacterized protein LOC135099328 isoform X2 n=1 Tax=Scylla paramamosain TaxID=85552 RepID=UPI003082A783